MCVEKLHSFILKQTSVVDVGTTITLNGKLEGMDTKHRLHDNMKSQLEWAGGEGTFIV